MRILVLNGASAAAGAAYGLLDAEGDRLRTLDSGVAPGRGGAGLLPMLLATRLPTVGWTAAGLDLLAVVVGPGSFTGLRASLALAHGLALGGQARVVGVTVGEALWPALEAEAGGDPVWCVSQARRDRVFIERPSRDVQAAMLADLPLPSGPVLLGGDAAGLVVAALANRGATVRGSATVSPSPEAIARAALSRQAGRLLPRAAQPFYVDPPEARLPAARPAP